MALTFTRGLPVSAGEPVASKQMANLSAAFNDRLRSGFADGAWRIADWWLSFMRGIQVGGSAAEFFERIQCADHSTGNWPDQIVGIEGGVDTANPLIQFMAGSPSFGTASEKTVIDAVPRGVPVDAADAWELAKLQRGYYDPNTGNMASPMFTAARNFAFIAAKKTSPTGTSFGGYQPGPDTLSPICCGLSAGDPPQPNYEIKFRSLRDGLADITYPGTCAFQDVGAGCTDTVGHVYGVIPTPWAYYVLKWDETYDILLRSDYEEGPYENDIRYQRSSGDHLGFALHTWAREFRGSDSQRAESGYWLEQAFDFQGFLGRQYALAPARGITVGDHIKDDGNGYPAFKTTSTLAADSRIQREGALGESHSLSEGGTIGYALLTCSNVQSGSFRVVDQDGVEIARFEDLSTGTRLVSFGDNSPRHIFCEVIDSIIIGASGSVRVDMCELMAYKPNVHDAYAVLRVSGLPSPMDSFEELFGRDAVDQVGIVEDMARIISDGYLQWFMAVSVRETDGLDPIEKSVNRNGVFDAVRRVSKMVRIVNRFNFTGYAVVDGKSVCWFSRSSIAQGLGTGDLFDGIGPSQTAVSTTGIVKGRTYIVSGASVLYMEKWIGVGGTFTGSDSVSFEPQAGAVVMEYNGIRASADAQGWSNEWLMGVSLKQYHWSTTSVFHESQHADRYTLLNRCLSGSHAMTDAYDIANRMPIDQRFDEFHVIGSDYVMVAPEAPSGYSYMRGENPVGSYAFASYVDCAGDPACIALAQSHYKSCPIYRPDYEIESAVMDGQELKVTFKTRFQHCDLAPSSIARDVSTWVVADMMDATKEPYRSDENGLREYLLHSYNGTHCRPSPTYPTPHPGNEALDSRMQTLPDNPYGACFPGFYFVKLMPVPIDDGNDLQDPSDTPFTHDVMTQAAVYLRAMCEGYVDGQTSIEEACSDTRNQKGWFDFTWDSFCGQASGTYGLHPLPLSQFPDQQLGWGVLPNTLANAEVFNQFVNGINLLVTARVMIPMVQEARFTSAATYNCFSATHFDGLNPCNTTHGSHCQGFASTDTGSTWGSWSNTAAVVRRDASIETVDHLGNIDRVCCGAGDSLSVITFANKCQLRWALIDANAVDALQPSWSGYLDVGGSFLIKRTVTTTHHTMDAVGSSASATNACPTTSGYILYDSVGSVYYKVNEHTVVESSCSMYNGDGEVSLEPPQLPTSTFVNVNCTSSDTYAVGPSVLDSSEIVETDVPAVTIPFTA